METALEGLTAVSDPAVIRGLEDRDNAGVYRIAPDLALVQTVDFFTPVVDDPYTYGQIAAANSLSDIYAMGARPLTAMNVVCFPRDALDISVLHEILRGGLDKMAEAGVVLVGGHSIDDPELKYGLSVTGAVDPKRLVTNGGAKPGDRLILTKPIGTGIISTALKRGAATRQIVDRIVVSMAALNRRASELMQEVGVHAATDITGFGFLGHTLQMAQNSRVGMKFHVADIPFFPGTADLAKEGFCPGGLGRNQDFYRGGVQMARTVPDHVQNVLFDPQTSGGLLISLAPTKARTLLGRLHEAGIADAAIIGEVLAEPAGKLVIE